MTTQVPGIHNEPGWLGSFTRNACSQAKFKNGTLVRKATFGLGDVMPIDSIGVVIGSFHTSSHGVFYCIEWDDKPKVAMTVMEEQLK